MAGISNIDPNSARDASIANLKTAVDAVATAVGNVATINISADVSLADMQAKLATIISDLDAANTSLTSILGEVGDNGTLLDTLHTDNTTIEGKLDTLHTDLGTTVHADLGTLHTDNGASGTGISQPTGGSGLLGWLSGIYSKLSGTLITSRTWALASSSDSVTIVPSGTQTVAGSVSVSSSALPTGAALDATLTGGTAKTQIYNGTNTADVLLGDSGQNSLVTSPARHEVSYTTAGVSDLVVDTSNYRSGSFDVISIGSTITAILQWSNDGSTWHTLPYFNVSNQATWSVSNITGAQNSAFACYGRYIRLHVTAQTGSAPSILFEFFATPLTYGPEIGTATVNSAQSGTWTVQPGNTQNTTPWAVSGLPPFTSLSAVTATGAGTTKNLGGASLCQSMQVNVGGTGSLSALTVTLEGSLDGSTWFTLGTISATTGGIVYSANQVISQIRANCTTRTAASGTPTVTAIVCAA